MRSAENEQKRRDFLEQVVDKIHNIPRYNNFYREVFYMIAKFGLQLKAKQEKLFEGEDWSNYKLRDELIKKIEEFLERHIK